MYGFEKLGRLDMLEGKFWKLEGRFAEIGTNG
jgi:hypothetical protein